MPYENLILEQDDYIASLIAEYENLQKKISDLEDLMVDIGMGDDLSWDKSCESSILHKQMRIMEDYANVLGYRIGVYFLNHEVAQSQSYVSVYKED